MNFTFPSHAMLSVFPTGDYKLIHNYYNKESGKSFVNATLIYTFKSSNIDTFG